MRDILHGMLFFTSDGDLSGLPWRTWDPELASAALRQLAQSVGARYGYAKWEQPPPDTAVAFKEEARTSASWAPPVLP